MGAAGEFTFVHPRPPVIRIIAEAGRARFPLCYPARRTIRMMPSAPCPPTARDAAAGSTTLVSRRWPGVLAAVAIAATLSGCGRKPNAAKPGAPPAETFRIGIMTGTAARDGEAFHAGEQLEHAYAGRVQHITYPDNFASELETVIAQLAGLAADPAVKVIVVGQAVPGSVDAARRIHATRPDVLIGFASPHEEPDSVDAACDIAVRLGPDSLSAPPDSVAIRAITRLLVDAADRNADAHDSLTVLHYLETEAGGPIRMHRHSGAGNQWIVERDRPAH
jgi:uncharacterized protein DUF3798